MRRAVRGFGGLEISLRKRALSNYRIRPRSEDVAPAETRSNSGREIDGERIRAVTAGDLGVHKVDDCGTCFGGKRRPGASSES